MPPFVYTATATLYVLVLNDLIFQAGNDFAILILPFNYLETLT